MSRFDCSFITRKLVSLLPALSSAPQSVARASPAAAAATLRAGTAQAPLQRGLSQLQLVRQLSGASLRASGPNMASIRPGTARQAMQIR